MSSIAFPASGQAQQEHTAFHQTAEQLYQSVEHAIHAPSPAATVPTFNSNTSDVGTIGKPANSATPSALGNETSAAPKPKITKRINARLQLAAALIEADNERILEKAQFWHIYHPPQANDIVHPPPPPQPALASQSAIFAPYREGASIAVKRHVRTWSAATGLSRLLAADDDGKRPSVDFLGVALPTEQRARSRAGSSVGGLIDTEATRSRSNSLFSNAAPSVLGRTSKPGSRPQSILALADGEDAIDTDADALSEWGVEKFLSKDERDRIAAGQRNRAQSLAGSIAVRPSFEQLRSSVTERRSMEADRNMADSAPAVRRASSEIVGASTAAIDAGDPKLELLAKIKLYRERQENLPPSEWDGPGPTATKDQVVEHIIASSDDNKRVSLREASRELRSATPPAVANAVQDSNSAMTAPAPEDSIIDQPCPSPLASSINPSAALMVQPPVDSVDAGEIAQVSEQSLAGAPANVADPSSNETQPASISSTAVQVSQPSLDQTGSTEAHDMVGIGSYSRSTSRRNSFLAGPLLNSHAEGISSSSVPEQQPPPPLTAAQDAVSAAPLSSFSTPQRRQSRGWVTDQFAEHDLGLGPSPFAAALLAANSGLGQARDFEAGPTHTPSPALDFNSLTTRQLQNVARNSTFPMHLGINRDLLADEEVNDDDDPLDQNGFKIVPKRRRPSSADFTALAKDLAQTGGENFEIQLGEGAEPDLSSANWGKPRKKWFRLSMMMDAKGKPIKSKKTAATDGDEGDGESDAEALTAGIGEAVHPNESEKQSGGLLDSNAADQSADVASSAPLNESEDIDDDFVSPPRRGPLRPLGLAARTPQTIVMPRPLQGTEFAPKLRLTEDMSASSDTKRHSLHVPDGFVLHDSRGGLPPMRSLVVHSANGPQPLFAAKAGNKKRDQTATRLKPIQVDRAVQVPAAAPRGIGRRAAAPTTALFRNHLVQHDDEREGWGFEAGTRVDDIFHPDQADNSDDDDKPLADIKKQSRSAKRAAKRLAKEKRKRKVARRIRRAKREEALKEGKSFKEVGVDELSPDEDLDLSSTSEEDLTETETESDLWASDDDKRWVDDSKPAGKLYGKSLLDLASERNQERKSKARFYGQVQLEDGEPMPLEIDDNRDGIASLRPAGSVYDDGASVSPSIARGFRDKPVGVNDTRERMEAVFGADQIWAREMAKRQQEDAEEAEKAKEKAQREAAARQQREAKATAKKERGLFTIGRKSKKNLGISNTSAVNSMVSLTGSDAVAGSIAPSSGALGEGEAQSELPVRSQTPVEPPVIALDIDDDNDARGDGQHGRRSLNLLAGEETAAQEWLIESDVEPETNDQAPDSSDDDVPLAQVKKNVASRPSSFAAGLALNSARSGNVESSDEELPLAALKEKRIRQSMMFGGGKLDLDFTTSRDSSHANGSLGKHSVSASSPCRDSLQKTNGTLQNGLVPPLSQHAASARDVPFVDDEDSDEDLPLGHRHPGGDAALVAMRTALENQKRAIKEARQAEKAQKRAARLAQQASANDTNANPNDGDEQARVDANASDAGDDSDEDDSEDDKPLGYVHPQAAIIAEQAALIRQLQSEREQQDQQQQQARLVSSYSSMMSPSGVDARPSMMLNRMSGLPSFMGGMGGLGMADPRQSIIGLPTNGSMLMGTSQFDGLPAPAIGLPLGMSMTSPSQMGIPVAPGSQIGVSAAMSPALTMPMIPGTPQMGAPIAPNPMTMMLDPKASSIHNWRTQVPADATAPITPPGGASAINSAI